MATAFQIQDQILVGAAADQGLHHGIGIAQPLVLLPGANSIFHGLFYTFCAGSKKDRCKPDHFCMVIRDHIADYSLVALFLHTVQKIAGAFPVIYGEREYIYMDLEKIAEIVIEKDLYVISDEIYSELTYAKEDHVTIASLPGMKERTVLINGFSKAFAMTGWRLGYACAPEVILKQMLKIHQYAIMCAPTTSQYAAVEALRNGDEDVQHMRESYDQRRRYLMNAFA